MRVQRRSLMCIGHIVGDPFALATISIAYVRLPGLPLELEKLSADVVKIAGVADSICRLPHLRHQIRFSEFRVVGDSIYAVLHSRCVGCGSFGLDT